MKSWNCKKEIPYLESGKRAYCQDCKSEKNEIKNNIDLKCYKHPKKNNDYDTIKNYFENKKNGVSE